MSWESTVQYDLKLESSSGCLLQDHLNGPSGTHGCADAAPFAIVEVDQNTPRFLISCDTEVRAKQAADLAGFARVCPEAAPGLADCLIFLKTRLNGNKPLFSLAQGNTFGFNPS